MSRTRSRVIGAGSIVAGAGLWELASRLLFDPLFLPPPSAVWGRFLELLADGSLLGDMAASGQAYGLGLLVAVVVGVLAGVAMAASTVVRDILDPWVSALNATPTIALAPLFILLLGLGIESKVAICAIVMLFPILLNTYYGFSTTDQQLVEVARAYAATRWQTYVKIKLPMALPSLIAGLRLAAAHGLVGVVVSELFGARAGIGLLIQSSAETFDTRALFVGITLLGIVGVAVTYALIAVERRVGRWRVAQQEGG
ncbi:ABC transporter permease [Amycolatopsis suaedae]|uniref:ABC transporter permease n=1 Tax=Amycolatopsis suaedae TaxID=2510978 RepID=A0A4Q7J1S3_9PSEU|nr:ABC transporter permease [Amycolatopsis suaedae]RZQ60807.1 ABC transporter permease [Amycolatopsis suaedae]